MNELIEKVAQAVIKREMAPVAIFMLESCKPLSRVGSQAMVFFLPLVRMVLPKTGDYEQFMELLDDREQLECLICRIEALEDARLDA